MVKISLFSDAFSIPAGEIVIDKDMIRAQYKEEWVRAPIQYLSSVTMLDKTMLGKVKARIDIYDVIGLKYSFEAMMS